MSKADLDGPGNEREQESETGGRKNAKPEMLGDVAPEALMELARVAGVGHEKYGQYNYLQGFPYSWNYNALQRHVHAFWGGETHDPDSGLHHLAHAAWHCLALIAFAERGVGTDDRPLRRVEEAGEKVPHVDPNLTGIEADQILRSRELSNEEKKRLLGQAEEWRKWKSNHPKREVPYA
jgi:hypothetical protein